MLGWEQIEAGYYQSVRIVGPGDEENGLYSIERDDFDRLWSVRKNTVVEVQGFEVDVRTPGCGLIGDELKTLREAKQVAEDHYHWNSQYREQMKDLHRDESNETPSTYGG